MDIINRLKNKVVVSCQAMPNEPFYNEICMIAMMKSVIKGGAGALRVAGARDVRNAKGLFDVPVIGLTKPAVIPPNWKEIVYITPSIKDTLELIKAGADIVAFDGTKRPHEDCTVEEIIKYIHINKRLAMADISTLDEGLFAEQAGADLVSTTLSGYTQTSPNEGDGPDFELLEQLVKTVKVPVVLEGRIWTTEQVQEAFRLGAHCVVIGSAITRPQLITKRFVQNRGV
ncbi:MAG: N-acetylmannosamine-6-phosphate 2-epimerase [Fusobacterium sp.]|nr:N-acetylmannosamine-6-phosphate 2-epimerase [Fusobacterium sp.]